MTQISEISVIGIDYFSPTRVAAGNVGYFSNHMRLQETPAGAPITNYQFVSLSFPTEKMVRIIGRNLPVIMPSFNDGAGGLSQSINMIITGTATVSGNVDPATGNVAETITFDSSPVTGTMTMATVSQPVQVQGHIGAYISLVPAVAPYVADMVNLGDVLTTIDTEHTAILTAASFPAITSIISFQTDEMTLDIKIPAGAVLNLIQEITSNGVNVPASAGVLDVECVFQVLIDDML